MKKLLFLSLIVIMFSSCENYPNNVLTNDLKKRLEFAYFKGQKDAIEGDIRIQKLKDSTYIWTKSPWNTNDEPLYNPRVSFETNFK